MGGTAVINEKIGKTVEIWFFRSGELDYENQARAARDNRGTEKRGLSSIIATPQLLLRFDSKKIRQAGPENNLLNTMPDEQHNDYYDMKITLPSNNREEPFKNEKLTR